MSTKYRLDYKLRVPVRGGGWKETHARRTVPGDCAIHAARKLRSSLEKKWIDGPLVTIEGGILRGPDGWIALNPDLLPLLNSNEANPTKEEVKNGNHE